MAATDPWFWNLTTGAKVRVIQIPASTVIGWMVLIIFLGVMARLALNLLSSLP